MTKFSGLNHLAFATGDMDRTIRFWRDLVGMRLIAATGQSAYKKYLFEISPGELLAFFEWPGIEPIQEKEAGVPAKGPTAFDHISIGVRDDGDLFELKDRLNAAGVWVSEVLDHNFIHSLYTFDPNGIAVEFSCPAGKPITTQGPVFTDGGLTAIAKEGPEPNWSAWPEVKNPTPEADRRIYPGSFFLLRPD